MQTVLLHINLNCWIYTREAVDRENTGYVNATFSAQIFNTFYHNFPKYTIHRYKTLYAATNIPLWDHQLRLGTWGSLLCIVDDKRNQKVCILKTELAVNIFSQLLQLILIISKIGKVLLLLIIAWLERRKK